MLLLLWFLYEENYWVFAEFMLISCELKLVFSCLKATPSVRKTDFVAKVFGKTFSVIKFLLFQNRNIQW